MAQIEKPKSDQGVYRFLEQAENYPHKPDWVKHIQTHISHVFMAPPYVYKVKKPVDFGFLNYNTLEKRKYYCKREVELNRRLCSGIYLGVVAIIKNERGYLLSENLKGEAVEYAVKMKKLEEQYFLHSYIDNQLLSKKHLNRVTVKLTDFYQQQNPGQEILKYGELSRIKYNTDENFKQTTEFIGQTIETESFEAIKYFTNQYLERNKALFRRRVEEKRIIDGHGDLHLEHIYITPENICIYDCIEFNKRFRYGDIAADLAFLAMDLDYNNCPKEGRYFVEQMGDKLADSDLLKIINFYKCYRAYVKGKVKSLQSTEEEVADEDQKHIQKKASEYFKLALRYALLGSSSTVLIFMGRVGTGKSTLAERTSLKLGIEYFSSDRIRKNLAGLPLNERAPELKRKDLYSAEMSEKTYGKLIEKTESKLQQGENVILDATFSRRDIRDKIAEKLNSLGASYLFIETCAPDKMIKARLKSRETEEEVISDARLEDFSMLNARYESPNETEKPQAIRIDTDLPVKETLAALYTKLIDNRSGRVN